MKKSKTLLIVGAVAIALFMFKDKLGFGKKSEDSEDDKEPMDDKEKNKVDAVIDASKSGSTSKAIEKAKEVAQTIQDANVVIKTPAGMPNIAIRTGKKKKKKKSGKGKAKAKQLLNTGISIFNKYYPQQKA